MTVPMIRRRRVLAAKIESTPGSAMALLAADAAFNVFDTNITPAIEFAEREGQSALSPLHGVTAGERGQVIFAVELHGSGDTGTPTPAWATTLLPACGMKEASGVWTPESRPPGASGSSAKTVTIGVYELSGTKARFKRLRGCMGTFVMRFVAGQVVRVEFTFDGIWDEPQDIALIAPDYPSVKPPTFRGSTFTIGSNTPRVAEVTLDMGNEIALREDPSDAAGFQAAVITGRRINGTLNPEARLIQADNPFYRWTEWQTQTMQIILGSGSADGNLITIDGPAFQITDIQPGERNGVEIDEISYQLNRSADAGDDEVVITFE